MKPWSLKVHFLWRDSKNIFMGFCHESWFRILLTMPICHEWAIYTTLRTTVKGISKSGFIEIWCYECDLKTFNGKVHAVLHKGHNNDSKLPRHNQRYRDKNQSYQDKILVHCNRSLCVRLVTHQRSAVGKKCLPQGVTSSRADHCLATSYLVGRAQRRLT